MRGERLKSARLGAGLNQTQLGEAVGLSQSMIGALERGDREPSIETVRALAVRLGVGVPWLLGEVVFGETGDCSPKSLLADHNTPPGLRDLATDVALCDALGITAEEWRALGTIELPGSATKAGYLNLLTTIRAICDSGR